MTKPAPSWRPPGFGLRLWWVLAFSVFGVPAQGMEVYTVGGGPESMDLLDIPWERLGPGDRVRIHWRPEPYRVKWCISTGGTPADPLVVEGVPNGAGMRPVIDGEDALTRGAVHYWNQERSVVRVGFAEEPTGPRAQHIRIEGLDIRGARGPATYSNSKGERASYSEHAAALHVDRSCNVEIRDCVLRDSCNGLFVTSNEEHLSEDIVIQGNHIHSNGIRGSVLAHNVYSAAVGIEFRFNRLGSLMEGSRGINLKDRSAGLLVEANWIEGGNRLLDLVDGVDSSKIVGDPNYGSTRVVGNVLLDGGDTGNNQVVHYGGDQQDTDLYRKGTLHFHHNTVVSTRKGSTVLLRMATGEQRVRMGGNIVYCTEGGSSLALLESAGTVELGRNWLPEDWKVAQGDTLGTVEDGGNSLLGTYPGFVDLEASDFRLAPGSPCQGQAVPMPGPSLRPTHVYRAHQSGEPRVLFQDLGAFERE